MNNYKLIYDCRTAHESFGDDTWILLLIGFVLLIYFIVKKAGLFKIIFASVFFIISLVWICLDVTRERNRQEDFLSTIKDEEILTAEGEVSDYYPYNSDGHKSEEHFKVNGIYFSYPDPFVEGGYRNHCENGGAICRNGQQVKIQYVSLVNLYLLSASTNYTPGDVLKNHIIRLEVK